MIGKRLKLLRGDTRQSEVAETLGISRARYAHYENNRNEPDYETLKLMANYFNVSTDYLLGITDEKNPYEAPKDSMDEELQSILDKLDSNEALYFKGKLMDKKMRETLKTTLMNATILAKELHRHD